MVTERGYNFAADLIKNKTKLQKNSVSTNKKPKKMETTLNELYMKAIFKAEEVIAVCDRQIEVLTNPEIYGCCLSKCNSIVINEERMMTVTTDENHMTTYEVSPLYPTYFSPEAARRIVENDIYEDAGGNRITLTIIGKLEYYCLLKNRTEDSLRAFKTAIARINA